MSFITPTVLAFAASFAVAAPNSTEVAPKTLSITASSVRPVTAKVAATPVPKKTSMIEGRIISNAGSVLADARVMLFTNGVAEPITTVRSDVDGSYRITVPSYPATYTMRIIRIGYVPVTLTVVYNGSGWEIPSDIIMTPIADVF